MTLSQGSDCCRWGLPRIVGLSSPAGSQTRRVPGPQPRTQCPLFKKGSLKKKKTLGMSLMGKLLVTVSSAGFWKKCSGVPGRPPICLSSGPPRWSGLPLCLLPRSCRLVVFSVLRLPVSIVKAQGAQLPVGPGPHLYLMVVDCSTTLLNSSLKTCSQSAISPRAGSLILSCASYYYFVFYAPSAKAH